MSTLLGTKTFKPHICLGDAEEYQTAVRNEQQLVEEPATEASSSSFDPSSIPREIWDAANLLAENGTSILKIYNELVRDRCVRSHSTDKYTR
jgi:hypothetical protein